MLAIMRQFEQMEQKEKAKAEPATPRSNGRPGGDESGNVEAPGSCKKRKEGDDADQPATTFGHAHAHLLCHCSNGSLTAL